MRLGGIVLAAVVGLVAAAPAAAEPAVGLVDTSVVTFDTATPGDLAVRAITGLQSPTERVIGFDWRPRTGQVALVTVPVGVAANALVRTYMLDPATGAATFVGSIPNTVAGAADVPSGVDVNPTVDRIRVVNVNDENFRINPNNGSNAGDDVNLNPAGSQVVAEAYDRNFDRLTADPPTTLYGISRATSGLVTQGGIDGAAPGGGNGGGIAAVGPLGVTLASTSDAGLDISPNTGTAFASLHPSGQPLPRLYTVNLATGAATEVGTFPLDVVDLTILPTPPPTPGTGGSSTGSAGGSTTTPAATATPSPTPLPPILNGAPLASLSLPKKARVAKVLQGRLKVGFTCDRACTAVASLVKGPTTAAAAAATRLATGRASVPAAGRGSITLKPTRAGKKALRRARARGTTLKATVSLAVTDAAGVKAAPLSRTLAIKR